MLMFLFLMSLLFFMMIFNNNFILSISIINTLNLSADFNFNTMNTIFSFIVILISMGVMFYSKMYFNFSMKKKFKINLLIFIMSMIMLINSSSMIMLIIGWDGLGISSFYLVSYYSNLNSSISSLITFFFNRLGDGFMMLFCSYMIFSITKIQLMNFNMLIMILFFICLITKSSQIPFGVWLPMAMSAPTPISSLVHSSTLVTAGIFILMKMNFIFYLEIQFMMMMFSIMTFALGGMFSLSILDLKKAVAFSTLSQLGFILFSLSMGNFIISFYHLIFHAFFKSSMFMNLGYFMILNFSMQDLRTKFKFSKSFFLKMTFFISCINLMGLFATSGFISKELILLFFFNKMMKLVLLLMMYVGCIFTSAYSLKFILFLFPMNFKSLKLTKVMKLNFFFSWIVISSFYMIFIPTTLMNLFFLEYEEMMFTFYKMNFYMIILISIILMKYMLLKFKMILFFFSSMLMILDLMNLILKKISTFLMNLFKSLIMIEDFIQFNMVLNFYKENTFKLNSKFIFMNMLFITMLMMILS